jgi:hypothetical protein
MGKSLASSLKSAISQGRQGESSSPPSRQSTPDAPASQSQKPPALEQPGDRTEAKVEPPAKGAKPKKAAAESLKNPWEASIVDPDAPSSEADPATDSQEAAGEPAEQEFKSESQKLKWGELKKKATERDTFEKELTDLRAKIQEFEKNPKVPEAIEQELAELRQFRAGYDIQNTPDYQEAVTKPYQAQVSRLQEVAEVANIPMDKLMDAVDEANTIKRARAIRDVLAASEAEMGEQEINIAVRAADTLHSEVYPKDAELRSKAQEIQQSLKGRSEVETAKQREARETAFKQASTEMFDTLKAKLAPLKIFEDGDLAQKVQSAVQADPSSEPMLAAYQAQAGVFVPVLVQQINDLRTQLAAAQKVLKARGASEPTAGDTSRQSFGPQAPKGPDQGRSLAESLRSIGAR